MFGDNIFLFFQKSGGLGELWILTVLVLSDLWIHTGGKNDGLIWNIYDKWQCYFSLIHFTCPKSETTWISKFKVKKKKRTTLHGPCDLNAVFCLFSCSFSCFFSVFVLLPLLFCTKKKQKSTRKSTRKSTKGTCLLRLVFILYAPGLCFLCFPPPVAFVLVSWCSSQMHWRVARTLMKSGYVNCFGHFLRFSHQPSFATQQQVPRFQGSSVAVPFWFVGLAKTTRHSQTQRLKHNSHCCCESLLQQLDAARSA